MVTKMQKSLLAVSLLAFASLTNAAIPAPTNYAELNAPIYNQPKSGSQQKLNLNFTEAPIRLVLQAIAEHLTKGIVLSEGVQGFVTLNLNEVTAEQALDLVLQQKGFMKVDQGHAFLITSSFDPSFAEALVSRTFRLNYARVEDLRSFFAANQNILTQRGSLLYDSRSNSIVVTDVDSVTTRLEKIISSLDVQLSQVEIEARIVQVSTNFGKDLGVKYGVSADSPRTKLLGALNGSISDFSKLGFTFLSGSFNLDVTLDAMQKDGLAKVISTPKITTLDNSEALISTGSQIPYQTSTITTTGSSINTQFKDALLSLSVTPSISPEGNVLMKLIINNDSLQGYAKNGEAIISKNEVKTQVSVPDSQTIVLGGVFIDSKTNTETKVPFFSQIRYINPLFKSRSSSNEQKELLIFLTPKIKKN